MIAEEIFQVFKLVFCEDVRFRILKALSLREAVGLRELARLVGIHHKNLRKYLEDLIGKGVVVAFNVNPVVKAYRLSEEYDFLRKFFQEE